MTAESSHKAMISRCYHVRSRHYAYYGARGIKVCVAWRKLPEGRIAFLKDMGPKPSPLPTLDRIDSKGNYEPGNCRWATQLEQNRNRANSIRIDGIPIVEWCAIHGLEYRTVYRRYLAGDRGEALARPSRRRVPLPGKTPAALKEKE